jgi:hypothetical protein
LLLLHNNAVRAEERSIIIAAVPPHCSVLVAQLACQYAQMWLEIQQELHERAQIIARGMADADSRS